MNTKLKWPQRKLYMKFYCKIKPCSNLSLSNESKAKDSLKSPKFTKFAVLIDFGINIKLVLQASSVNPRLASW